MTQQRLPLPFDNTLTVDHARQRGYTLVCDVLPAFIRENRELMATLAAEGCVLGEGSAGKRDEALGLYQPLQRKASSVSAIPYGLSADTPPISDA